MPSVRSKSITYESEDCNIDEAPLLGSDRVCPTDCGCELRFPWQGSGFLHGRLFMACFAHVGSCWIACPVGVHELEQQSSGTVDMKIVCLLPLGQPTISHIHIYIDNIKIPNHLEICKLKHELDSLQIWIPWCITNETYGNHGALTALQCYSFIQLSSILVLKMDVCAAPLVGMSRNDWTTEIQIFWDQTCAASWPILIFRISWEIFRIVP